MAESSEPIAVTRTEDDIPGAKLFEPWERHANHALWWWLLCHGIQVPVSLTKAKFNGTTWDTMHRNRIPLLLRLLANDTGCISHICNSDKIHCFTASDCITAAYISLESHSTSRTTKSRS